MLLSVHAPLSRYTDEVYDHLKECDCRYIITSSALLPTVLQTRRKFGDKLVSKSFCTYSLCLNNSIKLPSLYCLIILGEKNIFTFDKNDAGFSTYQELVEHDGPLAPKVCIDPDEDKSLLFFSSGTTGKPKGVIHTHTTLVAVVHTMR